MQTAVPDIRIMALRRFAIAISLLNILGRTIFGFEQPWSYVLAALATTYSLEIVFEVMLARQQKQQPNFMGGFGKLVDFLLPAHISGLAISMLLYSNQRVTPIIFAAAVAICSKILLRAPLGKGYRHFLNPSNFGITVTLLLFTSVASAPAYHFTENLYGVADLLLPLVITISGSFLNINFTKRLPLIIGWVGGFVLQGLFAMFVTGHSLNASLLPMSSLAFALFTFYMITDPGTTPSRGWMQFAFGASVAAVYRLLIILHIPYTLFIALTLVCIVRGAYLHYHAWNTKRLAATQNQPNLASGAEA